MSAKITYPKPLDAVKSHEPAAATAAQATLAAAASGKGWVVAQASVSFDDDTLKGQLVQIIEDPSGTPVTLWSGRYPGGSNYDLPIHAGIPVTKEKAVCVKLASGGAGKTGSASIGAYLRPQ